MCLYIKEGCKPEIAQKDILCYKVVIVLHDGHHWCSICRNTHQPYNKVDNAKGLRWNHKKVCYELIEIPFLAPIYERRTGKIIGRINDGFHAYTNEDKATKAASWWNSSYIVVRKAIVPKGAEYCYGTGDDIVATKMIVFGSEKAYQKYIASKESK